MINFLLCALNYKRNSFMAARSRQERPQISLHLINPPLLQSKKSRSWFEKCIHFVQKLKKIKVEIEYFKMLKDYNFEINIYNILGNCERKKINLLLVYFGLKPQIYNTFFRPKAQNVLQTFIKNRLFWSTKALHEQIKQANQLNSYLHQVVFKQHNSFKLNIIYPKYLQQQFKIQFQLQIKEDYLIQTHEAQQIIKE